MSISTISFNNASRAQIMRVQSELRDALVESSSNRHADVGRTLGRQTANAVTLRSQETSLDRQLQSNTLVTQRLTLTDDTLEAVGGSAQTLRDQLINGLNSPDFLNSAGQVARANLDQLVGALNVSVGGQFLFAGTQTDIRPMVAFGNGEAESPSAALEANFASFLAAAGKTAATVTGEELEQYFGSGFPTGNDLVDADGLPVLDEDGMPVPETIAFDDLFSDPQWGSTFSRADDTTIQSRISKSETIQSSVSANAQAMRDLMAGYAMVTLASEAMGTGARSALASAAQTRIGEGLSGLTALRSDIGNRLSRVEAADKSIGQQKDIVASRLADLEEVDMVEAANRVAALQTQLEASYRVTGLIREINILDYL